MQDSTITYKVTTTGIEEAEAKFNRLGATIKNVTINQNGSVTASGNLTKEQAELATATDKAAGATTRATKAQSSYIAHIAKTTILSALVNKLFLGMVDAAGEAVKQVDLFNNFPAAMGALGLSTKDASESLLKLRDYAAQSGVSLTEATQSVARFAEITKDVKAATIEFVGVKNALIAGGAQAQVQANALEQLTQAYSRGKPQLIEWRSLLVAMPAQLSQVAEAMGFVNAQALGEALTAGKVSMQDFLTELTKLSTGTGPIAAQALARMQGIQFAANVMKQTLTNGLAAIYQAVGKQNIISFFQFLTQVIIVLTQWAVKLVNVLISVFNFLSGLFGGPQIKGFVSDAQAAGGALGGAADSAGDLSNGLGDAGKNAKDLNKQLNKSLASFDKMNVLPDKTSNSGGGGSDTGGGGGAGGLDPTTAGLLNGLFDNLTGNLQEVSKWAKIFAGILSGILALKFGKAILKDLNDTVKTLKEAGTNAKNLGKALKTAAGAAKDVGVKVGKFGGSAAKAGANLGQSFLQGIAGALGGAALLIGNAVKTAILPALVSAGTAVSGAVSALVAGVAAALGVSLGAAIAIIAAVVLVIIGLVYLIWTNWDTVWGWIQAVFLAVWNTIVALWNTLYDIFSGPIKFLLQFAEATFILIVAIVATALELIFKLVVGTVALIYNVLAAIAGWVYNNVILPVVNFFIWLWNTVVATVTAAWKFIFDNILKPVAGWIYNNVILPIASFFRSLWNTVAGFVSGFVGRMFGFLGPVVGWISAHVISPIANLFEGLWNGIRNGLSGMINALGNIFGNLGGIAKTAVNGVIDVLNSFFSHLNIKVPDWVPGLGGKKAEFPKIPRLAKGGIVNQATMAIIGESGSEAVVPLENNTDWIDKLAAKINTAGNSTGQPVQLTVQIGEDQVASKLIDLINEKTQMSGRNTVLV